MSDRLPTGLWDSFRGMFAQLDRADVHKMLRLGRAELKQRHEDQKLEKARASEGYRGLSNFMAGVTWAMACRAALRESKGHEGVGKRPAAGDMWLPRELLYAVRHQVKKLGWHPITADNWTTVQANMLSQASSEVYEERRKLRAGGMGQFVPSMEAVQFRIPFATQMASVRIDDRFDFGGES